MLSLDMFMSAGSALAYEVHFGYMDTGDLFQEVDTYSEVESILMISNQLTLSF